METSNPQKYERPLYSAVKNNQETHTLVAKRKN